MLKTNDERGNAAASSVIFLLAFHLVRLGCFLGLLKSILIPSKLKLYLILRFLQIPPEMTHFPGNDERHVQISVATDASASVGELRSFHPSDKKFLTIGLERNYSGILQTRTPRAEIKGTLRYWTP